MGGILGLPSAPELKTSTHFWGFPKLGLPFEGPSNKDYSIFGSVLGSPYFGKLQYHMHIYTRTSLVATRIDQSPGFRMFPNLTRQTFILATMDKPKYPNNMKINNSPVSFLVSQLCSVIANGKTLRVQVPNNHILTQNQYYNY